MRDLPEFKPKAGRWTFSQLFWYYTTGFGMVFISLNISFLIIIGYILLVVFGPKWSLVHNEQVNYVLTIHWFIIIIGGIVISIHYGGLSWLTGDLCGPMVLCGP